MLEVRLDRGRTTSRSPDHRRHAGWGGPGNPECLPDRSIGLGQSQQEVFATDSTVPHPRPCPTAAPSVLGSPSASPWNMRSPARPAAMLAMDRLLGDAQAHGCSLGCRGACARWSCGCDSLGH